MYEGFTDGKFDALGQWENPALCKVCDKKHTLIFMDTVKLRPNRYKHTFTCLSCKVTTTETNSKEGLFSEH